MKSRREQVQRFLFAKSGMVESVAGMKTGELNKMHKMLAWALKSRKAAADQLNELLKQGGLAPKKFDASDEQMQAAAKQAAALKRKVQLVKRMQWRVRDKRALLKGVKVLQRAVRRKKDDALQQEKLEAAKAEREAAEEAKADAEEELEDYSVELMDVLGPLVGVVEAVVAAEELETKYPLSAGTPALSDAASSILDGSNDSDTDVDEGSDAAADDGAEDEAENEDEGDEGYESEAFFSSEESAEGSGGESGSESGGSKGGGGSSLQRSASFNASAKKHDGGGSGAGKVAPFGENGEDGDERYSRSTYVDWQLVPKAMPGMSPRPSRREGLTGLDFLKEAVEMPFNYAAPSTLMMLTEDGHDEDDDVEIPHGNRGGTRSIGSLDTVTKANRAIETQKTRIKATKDKLGTVYVEMDDSDGGYGEDGIEQADWDVVDDNGAYGRSWDDHDIATRIRKIMSMKRHLLEGMMLSDTAIQELQFVAKQAKGDLRFLIKVTEDCVLVKYNLFSLTCIQAAAGD
jgi:hypothetical protein